MCAFCCVDAWNRQVRGSTVNVAPELVLTRCMGAHGIDQVGPENVAASPALGGTPTIWPTPRNTPVATATLTMGVRVPDTPEATMMPLTLSPPLVEATADKAVVARLASAIPAASSAPCDL